MDRKPRFALQQGDEVAPLNLDRGAVVHGRGVGGARQAVQHGDLAEDVAGLHDVEDHLAAVGARDEMQTLPLRTPNSALPSSPLRNSFCPDFRRSVTPSSATRSTTAGSTSQNIHVAEHVVAGQQIPLVGRRHDPSRPKPSVPRGKRQRRPVTEGSLSILCLGGGQGVRTPA